MQTRHPRLPSQLLLNTPALCVGASLLMLACLPSPASSAAQSACPNSAMTACLQPFVDRHTMAGAVALVATKDKIVSLTAVGYADIAAQKKMKTDSVFWIASMTKPMTATALMMLVDEGKVKLDDPVENYLPEFKGQMVAVEKDANHILLKKPHHPILVRNVLSHTSGLPPVSPMERPTLDLLSLSAAVKSHAMSPLKFEPDSSYEYSNAGINTAGRIIEVVSGMPYERFMDERLIKPLGMKDTTFAPSPEQVTRLAKSYKANAAKNGLEETTISQLYYPLTDPRRQPMPAGGLFSTASDVAKFCQMILQNGVYGGKRYVSEAAVKQMTTKETGEAIKQGYGFGFGVGGNFFGHGGAYKTDMTIYPQTGSILVFMVQQASDWPNLDGKGVLPAAQAAAAKVISGN